MNNLFFLILDKTVKKSAPTTGELKKPHRWRPGTVALREISRYRESIQLSIPEKDFKRSVMKFTSGFRPEIRWQQGALLGALLDAAELYACKNLKKIFELVQIV